MADDVVDVLIIGAGASGAAVAWSLADTRMRILCLEQGDWMNSCRLPRQCRQLGKPGFRSLSHQIPTFADWRLTTPSTMKTLR